MGQFLAEPLRFMMRPAHDQDAAMVYVLLVLDVVFQDLASITVNLCWVSQTKLTGA